MRKQRKGLVRSALLIALVIGLTLLVAALPGRFTAFDMTDQGYYTLSAESEELLRGLDKDVEIVLLAVEGSEDVTLLGLLDRYADLSRHVSLITVDPAAEPEAAAAYAPSLRYGNSIAVVSGERSYFIDYTELYVSDYSAYYSSGDTADIVNSFHAERAITAAVDYVTNDALPKLYCLSGHEELSLNESVKKRIAEAGIQLETLELGDGVEIPADCSCILINAPSYDISPSEREKISAYLVSGGNMLLLTAYSEETLPELAALMEGYGCSLEEGLVVEQDRDHYVYGYYDCILPDIGDHEVTASLLATDAYVIIPGAQGIVRRELPNVLVTPLLESSPAAYSTTDLSSVGKKDGDRSGPFTLAAAIESGGSRLLWYATGFLLNETYTQNFGGANEELFLESVCWLCGSAGLTEAPGKVINTGTLQPGTEATLLTGALFCLVIPLVFAVCGGIILLRRRRGA
ncbi:MAG: hypothetical protein E7442_03025 [Ruminococcaceae bacterium]|nr:hypothetical protein [Oscillospiraceae bacterium]